MCRDNSCGCGGGRGGMLGLAVAILALAGVVSAAWTLIGDALTVVLVTVYSVLAAAVAGLYWLLRREGVIRPRRRRPGHRALPAPQRLAIEAPRQRPGLDSLTHAAQAANSSRQSTGAGMTGPRGNTQVTRRTPHP